MLWALHGQVVRIQDHEGKGVVSVFVFINRSGELVHNHPNVGQSNALVVYEQL